MSGADDPEDLSAPPRHDTFLRQLARPVEEPRPGLVPGTRLGARYEIRRLVGAGGMGEVYLARDHVLEREVALKVHRDAGDPDDAERTRREAVAMAQLAHPNVVTVFEAGAAEDRAFVAMEYVEGTTLRGWLAAAPRTPREILAMLREIGAGLAAAHAAGLVHLDFKPENVLVGRDGRPRVSDFGLARLASGGDATATTIAGTPAYMAPEQAAGLAVDARSDQFAFCVVAWEALYGVRPWSARADGATVRSTPPSTRSPTPPPTRPPSQRTVRGDGASALAPGGGKGRIQRALVRGLAADPDARFPALPALLGELVERPPWLAIALGTVATAAAAVAVWQLSRPAPPTCARAGDEAGAAIAGAFRARYRETAQAACKARLDGAWSRELAAKATACLTVERMVATAAVDRDVAACADPARLAGWPPGDAAAATARAALLIAETTRPLVLPPPAAADTPLVAARRLRVQGRRALASGQLAEAARLATTAHTAARAAGDAETALLASGDLVELAGVHRGDPAAIARVVPPAIADAEALAARAPEAAARSYLLAARAGLADVDASDTDAPAAWIARAFALLGETRPTALRVEAHELRAALHDRTGRGDDSIRDRGRALALARARFGADHDEVARVAAGAARAHVERGRADEARAAAREADRILATPVTSELARLRAWRELGLARLARGDRPRGLGALGRARAALLAIPAGERGDLAHELAALDGALALALLEDGSPADAVRLLDEQRALREPLGVADTRELATIYYNLAVAHRDTGALPAALARARTAVERFAQSARDSDGHRLALALVAQIANRQGDHATALTATAAALGSLQASDVQVLAWPRVERARALLATGGPRLEIARLLAEARAMYANMDLPARLAEVAELEALLRRK